ncbi:MAG: tyrosine-protein phosphatase [Spirochaetaceae bacterium]|jgi:protein tyrosine/serine phosphatase|nr:tyrosine-protein phosphatase [Spirochaetaceae bacterium]
MRENSLLTLESQLVNFREIRIGKIAPGTLYRSCHPITWDDDIRTFAKLAHEARIATVINMNDTRKDLEKNLPQAPWYNKLYKTGSVWTGDLTFNFRSPEYRYGLQRILRFMIEHEAPYLIHCFAGIDRTGFLSALLEALMGGTFDEIADDYVQSFYFNTSALYEIDIRKNPGGQAENVILELFGIMNGGTNVDKTRLDSIAEQYLLEMVGLTAEEVAALKTRLNIQ